MHIAEQHDDQLIELGIASEETKGAEGPILDTQGMRNIPGITAD